MLRGVQFGVLVFADWGAVWGHAVWGCWCRCCFRGDGARVFLHLDGRVHGGMQFGVLVLVVFWDVFGELFEVLVTVRAQFAILTPGCHRACR